MRGTSVSMTTFIGNKIDDSSSNTVQGCLHLA